MTRDPVTGALEQVLARARGVTSGAVADYIPELAHIDPELCGLAVVSVRGHEYAVGDTDVPFTLQSVSKAFVYALALSDLGLEEVLRHVGCEPSGEPFNAISLDDAGRPANPMINAGALVTTALVRAGSAQERFARIRATMSAFAGRDLEVDEAVYASESATGDRNRALAFLTRASGVLPGKVEETVDVYFRTCALRATCADLAVMAATLANGGVHPVTGTEVVTEPVARHTLAVMASCGMYDRSGEWGLRVGLPAKSGVGGGIVAVLPGQVGIGVFAPRLDEAGNSSRGVAALTALSQEHDLHLLRHPIAPTDPVLRREPDGAGTRLVVVGELDFVTAEQVVHEARALAGPVHLDLSGVTRTSPAARRLLAALEET